MRREYFNVSRWAFAVAIMIFVSVFSSVPAKVFADTTESAASNVDFVLVIDCSGSMTNNDQQGLTLKAAKYLVSQLPLEKARLAVILFGDDYGEDHYPISEADLLSSRRIKVAYDLTEINSEEERSKAQAAVDSSANSNGEYTPMGYAVETAVRVLDAGGAAKGKAAIILMSDGQIEGQTDSYNDGLDFVSIDSATKHAHELEWPIYCMELNYSNVTQKGTGLPGIAYHQMRENIPSKTGTDPIELKSADQAKEEVLRVVKKFFDPDSKITPIDAEKEQTITISDLVAEQNINILGDMSKVTSVEVVSPDGTRNTYEKANLQHQADDRMVTYDESSTHIKLIMPQEGDWKITVHTSGETILSFDLISIAIREMNLDLFASHQSGEIDRETEVEFNANFSYRGTAYEAEQFYAKTKAYLVIDGTHPNRMQMEASGSSYRATYLFENNGFYAVHVSVESEFFRDGTKESIEEYDYTIETKETLTKGIVPDQTLKPGGEKLSLDMSEYFESPDGDRLVYTASLDKEVVNGDLVYTIDGEGKLDITTAQHSGDYVIRVGACDGKGEKEVYQYINVEVKNSLIQLCGDGRPINIKLSASGKDEYVLYPEDYFYDPDNALPIIHTYDASILEQPSSGKTQEKKEPCVEILSEDGKLTFKGLKSGKTDITVQAIDGNDQKSYELVLLHIDVQTAMTAALNKFKIPLTILGAVLVVALGFLAFSFMGREIYGRWRITFEGTQIDYPDNSYGFGSDDEDNDTFEICKLRHCKGRTVTVDTLLKDIERRGGFGPKVKLVAGDKRSRSVYLEGIDMLDSFEINGDLYEGKEKKVSIRRGSDVLLKNDKKDLVVKIERS